MHYLSTPGYSQNAMLMFTGVNLKLNSHIEKNQFVESIMRCGISVICKDYGEANNEFLKPYNANKHISYIIRVISYS